MVNTVYVLKFKIQASSFKFREITRFGQIMLFYFEIIKLSLIFSRLKPQLVMMLP